MPEFDLAIRGGTVVTAADVTRCDIGISHGRIAALASEISDASGVIDATGFTPFEGFEVTGWPVKTILRGRLVFDEGKIVGRPGDGKFLARALSPYAVPKRGYQSDMTNQATPTAS